MLDINLTTILLQLINFAIMAALLYFLLFKRVFASVNARKARLADQEAEIAANLLASQQAKIELEKQIANAQSLIDEKVAQAKAEMEVNRYQIVDTTKQEAERIIKEAVKTAEIEQKRSMESFNDQITASVIEIVKNLLHQYAPEVIHNSLVQQTNERIWELGKKEMDRVETIRRSLQDREPTLSLESAFALSKEQQANLIRTFSALADKNLKLDMSINKELGSGIRIRLGDFIINNSLDALLNDMEEQAKREVALMVESQNNS